MAGEGRAGARGDLASPEASRGIGGRSNPSGPDLPSWDPGDLLVTPPFMGGRPRAQARPALLTACSARSRRASLPPRLGTRWALWRPHLPPGEKAYVVHWNSELLADGTPGENFDLPGSDSSLLQVRGIAQTEGTNVESSGQGQIRSSSTH